MPPILPILEARDIYVAVVRSNRYIYARGFKNGVLLASAKITAIGRNRQNADTIHVHIFQQVGITTHPEWILTFKLIFLMYCACNFIKFILTIRYGLKGQSISTPNHS